MFVAPTVPSPSYLRVLSFRTLFCVGTLPAMEATETELQLAQQQRELAEMLKDINEDLPAHDARVEAAQRELERLGELLAACDASIEAAVFPPPPIPPAGAMQAHFAKTKVPRGPHFEFDSLAAVATVDTSGDMQREKAKAGLPPSPVRAARGRSPSPPQPVVPANGKP